ncbi:MAG: hypothetical protein GFH27_549289n164 [Chloroflexi bacterium AL-W]|nr:hypothetical protein [Chloroflexi bacterium AL-N1]NOK66897.1 hypothetical protein [Chloroflexi bacterium AL-N10]NOK74811.1 hypothetical protein [Chloroflexi bacterium AL-N5]NOK81499.1 hypothetical protein [Chloroflexi bacterium AL-W]NOK88969.1 hypothetical protein [Chloroflexi bacterium AL-N15]
MTLRFIRGELLRHIFHLRFLIIMLLMVVLSLCVILVLPLRGGARFAGSLTLAQGLWLSLVLPIIAGVVAAGSLAEDRRSGYTWLVLAQGLSRRQYVLSKAVVMSLTAVLVALIGYSCFFIGAALTLPWGDSIVPRGEGGSLLPIPGPVPDLFLTNPLLNDLLGVGMLIVATGVLALIGLPAGSLTSNIYIVSALPFVLFIVGLYSLTGAFAIINPYTYLDVWWDYKMVVPESALVYAGFVYWLSIGMALIVSGVLFFEYCE